MRRVMIASLIVVAAIPAADATQVPGFDRILALLPRYLRLDLRQLLIRDQDKRTEMAVAARDAAAHLPGWDDAARLFAQALEAETV